jgi:hypothetical protein
MILNVVKYIKDILLEGQKIIVLPFSNKPLILIILATFLFHQNAWCQDDSGKNKIYKNAFFYELLGHGLSLSSVNYERIFFTKSKHIICTLRTGLAYNGAIGEDPANQVPASLSVPFVLSFLAGDEPSYIQFGIGYTATFRSRSFIDSLDSPPTIYLNRQSAFVLILGYRHVSSDRIIWGIFPGLVWTNSPSLRFQYNIGFIFGGVR